MGMGTVFPWPIWAKASPRTYPYGDLGFIFITLIGVVYLILMWFIGISFYKAFKASSRREIKYFSIGLLSIAFFDTLHSAGNALFYFLNDSRVPIEIGSVTIYYLPFATSLSTMGLFICYTMIYLYAAVMMRNQIAAVDKFVILLGIISIFVGFNPYNWWHMVPPEGAIDTKPLTGTLILIMGFITAIMFIKNYRVRLKRELREKPHSVIRLKLTLIGIILLVAQIFLMTLHGTMATIKAPWAATALLIITGAKLISLSLSVTFIYIGTIWPAWAEKIFKK